jgi:hypothetical protein
LRKLLSNVRTVPRPDLDPNAPNAANPGLDEALDQLLRDNRIPGIEAIPNPDFDPNKLNQPGNTPTIPAQPPLETGGDEVFPPFLENREYVPNIPPIEDLTDKTDQELDRVADDIAGKALQNAQKAAKEDSGAGKSGRSGQNARSKINAGNGLKQAANELPSKHPLRERLKTRGERLIKRGKADNHPSR